MENNTLRHNRQICKVYTSQIKSYFPIITKREKSYIKSCNIYSFYPIDRKLTLEDLYAEFGRPEDIFSEYLSSVDSDVLYKEIRKTKIAKRISILIFIATIIVLFFCVIESYRNYKQYEDATDKGNVYWIEEIT